MGSTQYMTLVAPTVPANTFNYGYTYLPIFLFAVASTKVN